MEIALFKFDPSIVISQAFRMFFTDLCVGGGVSALLLLLNTCYF